MLKRSKNTQKASTFNVKSMSSNKAKTQRLATSQLSNVNSYKHFLSVPHTGHNYIQWAFGLRSSYVPKQIKTIASPPETYYKTTQSSKHKHTSADIKTGVNISEFSHLALHRIGNHPSCGQLNFETTLRQNDENSKEIKDLKQRQKHWCSLPRRDRHEDPVFIRSKSLKKKIVQPQQYETACDGRQNFPKFTEKIIRIKNTNQYRHMIKGKVNLPSLSWQVNLRSY